MKNARDAKTMSDFYRKAQALLCIRKQLFLVCIHTQNIFNVQFAVTVFIIIIRSFDLFCDHFVSHLSFFHSFALSVSVSVSAMGARSLE